jgi:16S rRNA processing protein RimM
VTSEAYGAEGLVAMGVVHPHGLRGELKLVLYHPDSSLDWRGRSVTLARRDGNGPERRLRVKSFRRSGPTALLTFEGVGDRTAAEALDGLEARLPRAELPELGDDEVYLGDLVGLRVVEGERELGVVREVRVYPAASCAVVPVDAGELEIPVHEPYVVEVDLRERVLRVAFVDDLRPEAPGPPDERG